MRFLCALVVLAACATGVAAQDQANPHSHVAMAAIESTSPGTASATVTLELGLLQCQGDFEAVVDLVVQPEPGSPPGLIIDMPTTVTVSFDSQLFVLGYPYNYASDAQVQVLVRSGQPPPADLAVRLNVTASYPGGDVANCTSTGPMPPATTQATVHVPLAAVPANASGSDSIGPGPGGPSGEPGAGGTGGRESPVPAAAFVGALVLGAAWGRRRKVSNSTGRKGSP